MHIRAINICDVRSIQKAELAFLAPGDVQKEGKFKNINVLLGGNGVGKSTVLRSIAMSIIAPVLEGNSGFVSDGNIRRLPASKTSRGRAKQGGARRAGPKRSVIESSLHVDEQDLPQRKLPAKGQAIRMKAEIERVGDSEKLNWLPPVPGALAPAIREMQHIRETSAFFLVGYGATRRVEQSRLLDFGGRSKARISRYERVAGLFEEHYSLIPLSSWLPDYEDRNPGRYKQVVTLLNRLLPEACQMHGRPTDTATGREYMFSMSGIDVPFRALSDGYRAYLGWISDMLFHLCMGAPRGRKLVENKGVVLIDEIDLHLHPDWQRTVLPTLSKALPNIQFVVTTHSPLVVGSLEARNIQLMDATEADGTVSKNLPEKVHGKSAGQLLLSPYFGLESTRAPDVEKELKRLNRARQGGDRKAALQYLELLSSGEI